MIVDVAGSNINWPLGVFDRPDYDKDELFVSYMTRTDTTGTQWLFPQDAEIHITHDEQVIKQNVLVRYFLITIMRYSLEMQVKNKLVLWHFTLVIFNEEYEVIFCGLKSFFRYYHGEKNKFLSERKTMTKSLMVCLHQLFNLVIFRGTFCLAADNKVTKTQWGKSLGS